LIPKNIFLLNGFWARKLVETIHTGSITKFSAKENFRKILKVSHFSLRFSLDEKCDKIKTSYRVSPEFTYVYRVSLVFSRSESKISNKTLWECLTSLLVMSGENPKWKWLIHRIFLIFFLAENLSMPPVTIVLSLLSSYI